MTAAAKRMQLLADICIVRLNISFYRLFPSYIVELVLERYVVANDKKR
jgi:hypothetical protein